MWDPEQYGLGGSGYDNTGPASDGPGYWDATNPNNTVWLDLVGGSDITWNNTAGYTALFGTDPGYTSGYTVTLNSSISAAGIIFSNNPSYTIAGTTANNLTLGSGGLTVLSNVNQAEIISAPIVMAADQVWNNSGASPAALVVSGAVSGTNNITTLGTVNLSGGASTFTGNVTVGSGTLSVTGSSTSTTTSALGAMTSTSRTITVPTGSTLAFATNNTFGGGVFTDIRPTIVVNGGTMTTTSFTALGLLQLNGATVTSTGTGSTSYAEYQLGTTVSVSGSTPSTFIATTGTGSLNLAALTEFAVGSTGGAGTDGADLVVAMPMYDRNADSGGAGSLLKSGPGTMLLAGTSTYTGSTNVAAGRLIIGSYGGSVGRITATSGINLGVNASSGVLQIGDAANPATVITASLSISGTGTGNEFVGGNAGISTLILNNTTAQTYGGNIGGPGTYENNLGLTKTAAGVLTLTGATTYAGPTTITGGTLSYGSTGTASGSTLNLSGGILAVTGTQSLAFNGLIVGPTGASSVSNTGTIAFGAITRPATGGSVDFGPVGTGTLTTTTANTNGILGGYATIGGGAGFATVNAGTITAYTGYTETSVAGATPGNYLNANIDVDVGATPTAAINPNTVRFNTAAATTLALTGTNVVTAGGILVTPTVGANVSTITGGTLTATGGADLIVNQFNAGANLSIGSAIADNGSPVALTKTGTGTLVLTSSNTYTGGTTVDGTGLAVTTSGALGTGPLTVTVATAATSVSSNNAPFLNVAAPTAVTTLPNNIVLPAPTVTSVFTLTRSASANAVAFNGVISGGNASTTLELNTGTSGDSTSSIQLNGANTFTAPITLNRGVLYLGNASALGAASNRLTLNTNVGTTPSLTFGVSGTFANPITFTAGNGMDTGANNVVLTSAFSGASNISKWGTGTLTLNVADSETGTFTLNAGTVSLNSAGGAAGALANPTIVVNSGATLALNGTSNDVLGYTTGREALNISGGSVVNNTLKNTMENVITMTGGSISTAAGGSFELDASGFTATSDASGNPALVSIPLGMNKSEVYTVNRGAATPAADMNISSVISTYSGTPALVKAGTGILLLSGNNTYTGPTNVNAGILALAGGTSVQSPTITVSAGATLQLNASDTLGYTSGKAAVTLNGGTLQSSGSVHQTMANTLTMVGGTVTTVGTPYAYFVQFYNGAGLTATSDASGNAATISANSALQATGAINFNVSRGSVAATNGTPDAIISGNIVNQNSGNYTPILTKSGNGVMVLSGANTYPNGSAGGSTNVSAGVLRANNTTGSATGIGAVNVAVGATLGGSGNVSGGVTVLGTITAGPSDSTVGTLLTGTENWNTSGGGGIYVDKVAANAQSNDRLVMSGLTISASAGSPFTINLTGTAAPSISGTYVLAVDTGATSAAADPFSVNAGLLALKINGAAVSSANYTLSDATDTTGFGGVDLVLTATPEPASLLLLATVAAPGLLGRRRRRSA
jgi:fibronectin-binding autotransporter adhesin